MKITLFNTLGREKQVFEPIVPGKAGLYTCGPTVYDYQHIGNFRTFMFEDLLKRVLIYNGYDVTHIMNITDVGHLVSDGDEGEDKMEKGSARTGKTVWEIAEYYTQFFLDDAKALNLLPPVSATLCHMFEVNRYPARLSGAVCCRRQGCARANCSC